LAMILIALERILLRIKKLIRAPCDAYLCRAFLPQYYSNMVTATGMHSTSRVCRNAH
jgi:hypothetical protein